MKNKINGISIPDSALVREATKLVSETESSLLLHHSIRVYLWGALIGTHKKLKFDPELLYIAAIFHDLGLTPKYSSVKERFEVDSANAARDFLRKHHLAGESINTVWDAIALHTTPGIAPHKSPEAALVMVGVETDVLGVHYEALSEDERIAVLSEYPRGVGFKEGIIDAFYEGFCHKPDSTFGTMNDDVLADKDPTFHRVNFCQAIRNSPWSE